jgi:antitoxin MazE
MDTKIVTIGNSKGVRLPKSTLEQCKLQAGQALEVSVDKGRIVLTPRQAPEPRAGWETQFRKSGAPRAREDLWSGLPLDEAWDR